MDKYNGIIIHQKLSASVQEQRVLLSCGGQYYGASQPIVELVEELQRHETEGQSIIAYAEKKVGKYTPEQVRMIIDKFITPMFVPKEKKHSFLYEKELFSAMAIDKFSDAFRFLFSPLGYITNIWAEVLLMLSGWISLMRSACFTTACDTRRLCPLRLFGLYIGRHVTGHRISAISGSCATQSGNSLAVVGRYGKIPPASQSGIRPS